MITSAARGTWAALTTAVVLAASASDASAAAPWVDRHLTLPAGDWAFDVGAGVAHSVDPRGVDLTGVGANAEVAVGVADRVELGVRGGLRFGDPEERTLEADRFGRLFDRQTFDGLADVEANPELRARFEPLRGPIAELALEARLVLPVETGTEAGVLFGLPLAFHLGRRVRLDTGVYVPIVFGQTGTATSLSAPLDVWIQATRRVWLGPMTGVVIQFPGNGTFDEDVSLGLGFGYSITRYADFKAMALFPSINRDGRSFGLGAGVEFRIE